MSGSRAHCAIGLFVLIALGIIPFSPHLRAAIQDGGLIASAAQAATTSMPVEDQHRLPAEMAQDLVRDSPNCLSRVERRPVRPVVQPDGSYRITLATVLAYACVPQKQ